MGDVDELVELHLVPVEVFGSDDCCVPEHNNYDVNATPCPSAGYGLSDAVSSWSDCNRANGHIYRVDDLGYREPDETVTIWVRRSDLAFFEKTWGTPWAP